MCAQQAGQSKVNQKPSQAPAPGQRVPPVKQSVTVSAGYTKEELAIADQFDAKYREASDALGVGNAEAAVAQFRSLLDMLAGKRYLEHKRARLLTDIGAAYLAKGDTKNAIVFYEQRLELEKDACKPGAFYPSTCADAQMDLAMARMSAGEASTALELMRKAIENFRLHIKSEDDDEFRVLHTRHLGEALLVQANFLVRTREPQKARSAVEEAVKLLEDASTNDKAQLSIRESARKLLNIALQYREQLKDTR